MNAAALERALLGFINGSLVRGRAVTRDDRLFEDRHLDSLRVLEVVTFLERTLGRQVPDRMIRLANFRSVRAIAIAFSGDLAPRAAAELPRYHTTPERFASPIAALRNRGWLAEPVAGAPELAGPALELFRCFDATFSRWGRELGSDDRAAPATIAMDTLNRAGFAADFPQLIVRPHSREAFTPAACYHRYQELADATLESVIIAGVHARCTRAEADPRPLERQTEFTMREIVVLGSHDDVERVRRRLLRRMDRFVTALALDGAVEAATDPFFTAAAKARELAQRAGDLKHELRLTLEDSRRVAVASFNRHGDHFGRRFAIVLRDGSPARSGCVAFGIERWVLAFLTQHGLDEDAWPRAMRDAIDVQRAHAAAS